MNFYFCFILLLISSFTYAGNIKGKTNLDSSYEIVFRYIENNNTVEQRSIIGNDGKFATILPISSKKLVKWDILKRDGLRQMPPGFYFYVTSDNTTELDYNFIAEKDSVSYKLVVKGDKENVLLNEYFMRSYNTKNAYENNNVDVKNLSRAYKNKNRMIEQLMVFDNTVKNISSYPKDEILSLFDKNHFPEIPIDLYKYRLIDSYYMGFHPSYKLESFKNVICQIHSDFAQNVRVRDELFQNVMDLFFIKYRTSKNDTNLETLYEEISTQLSNPKLQKEFKNHIAYLAYLQPGANLPDVEIVDKAGNKHTLKELKGKYIYLDLWFVGCHWCYEEVPFIAQLEEEFPDIQFVSLCQTRNDVSWKGKIKELKMHGLQFREDKKPYFTDIMQVTSFPRFFVYAPDGTLVNSNAPRARNIEEARAYLKELVGK